MAVERKHGRGSSAVFQNIQPVSSEQEGEGQAIKFTHPLTTEDTG